MTVQNVAVTAHVHLVLMGDRGGLFGIYLDEERAHQVARNIEGLVAAVPISGDYRKSGTPDEESP